MKVNEIQIKGEKARSAATILATATTSIKNKALHRMASALRQHKNEIIAANALDLEAGKRDGLKESLFDRLLLTEDRIEAIAAAVEQIITLQDPVGVILNGQTRPNGLQISKVQVPLGVIGIIYEARPNVTVDAAALCLKAGNAALLRGGKSAFHSNMKLVEVLAKAVEESGLPVHSIQLVENTDRALAEEMMKANGLIDVLIPRGGAALIQSVVKNATVPVIETGVGNCHVYIDETADGNMAQDIAVNAKTQRPGVCNAIESLLVHEARAESLLPEILESMVKKGVEIRGCEKTCALFPKAKMAQESDWGEEFLSLILAVKIVPSLEAAIDHIRTYSSKHTEAIVTQNVTSAEKFLAEIDAAAVYVNASTRFTDGFEFGFGAEIGISTQKLHARGPMGLQALTSSKYIVRGNGQIRS
ncbi:MAG: glutamate-5-semialdehyde dehydrogenase [Calditrichaeota bacterium]|nr:MAG: glutamate-5-semialdehyde dehydrogenase [Calditrichota bacterium]